LKEIKAVIKDKGKRIKVKGEKGEEKSNEVRSTKKGRKMKFRPEITRVKLNPEQAVLSCNCHSMGYFWAGKDPWRGNPAGGQDDSSFLAEHGCGTNKLGRLHGGYTENPWDPETSGWVASKLVSGYSMSS